MGRKDGVLLFALLVLVMLISLSGCFRKTEVIICTTPQTIVGERCCLDANNNSLCDDTELSENATAAGICGNGICDEDMDENCTTCWKDCGACKKIVYVYVPRNFTLTELTTDLNRITRDGIKFSRDRQNANNVSDFLFFDKPVPRYFADFMGIKYKPLYKSRWIVLSQIVNENYNITDPTSLLDYVNMSNWYLTYNRRTEEMVAYEARLNSGNATSDYPTQPTGYQKQFRYLDWTFKNFTKTESVVYEGVSIVGNETVESVYASITGYNVTYKYHEYMDLDFGAVEAFKDVDETRLGYIHSLSFICARNLVITIYDYDYDGGYEGISPQNVLDQISMNRQALQKTAEMFESLCNAKYSNKNFVV
jgi:hypothetical protein